ncbi:hypothetical protein ACFX2I_022097 [Malus domestica]
MEEKFQTPLVKLGSQGLEGHLLQWAQLMRLRRNDDCSFLFQMISEGHAAAFGDDIAIECLATKFKREIYVVQAHGSDAMVDEENCVFFLPHRPRSQICELPFFLFMKGTGWCGAGAAGRSC